MAEVVNNPYEGVDWSSVNQHRDQTHIHTSRTNPGKSLTTAHETVDKYQAAGIEVMTLSDGANEPIAWPWTDFSAIDASWEDRDPDAMGMVAYPGAEQGNHDVGDGLDHVLSLFTEIVESDYDPETRYDVVEAVVQSDPDALAVLAHPSRYNRANGWRDYIPDFEDFEDLIAVAAYEKDVKSRSPKTSEPLWDRLNAYFCPEDPIWGWAEDDPGDINDETKVDVRFNTLLLSDDEFDQAGVRSAYKSGRFYISGRTSNSATYPTITDVSVDTSAKTITITGTNYEDIVWFSNGRKDATGTTVNYDGVLGSFVRAKLIGPDGWSSTQPFALSPPKLYRERSDGSVEVAGEIIEDGDTMILKPNGDQEVVEVVESDGKTYLSPDGVLHVAGTLTEA